METTIDWNRVLKALRQFCRQQELDEFFLPSILEKLQSLCPHVGEYSKSRSMMTRIGKCLLQPECFIWAPACPDYAHTNGRYNFQSIGGGLSLLAEKHILFLRTVTRLLGIRNVTILIADHEADDEVICKSIGKTREEFLELIRASKIFTLEAVSSLGWSVELMTDVMPLLIKKEEEKQNYIRGQASFEAHLFRETNDRIELYQKISNTLGFDDMKMRTVRTAAQYLALGEFAAEKGAIIANHTTTNLSWYLKTDVAVLHNPVKVY